MTKVAFLGLGRMGSPMAARLAHAGHELTVWNRTPRPAAVPAEARLARSPKDAARSAEMVITMVADGSALKTVLTGGDGVLATAEPGSVLIDMSTIGPDSAKEMAKLCRSASMSFIDAPVSGSIPAATAGTLLAMIGGSADSVRDAMPVMAALTSRQIHLGPVGSGAAMKLAVNLLLAVTNQAIAETLELTDRAGIPTELAYDVLQDSAVGSSYLGYKRDAFLKTDETPVAFSVDLMRKDAALALDLAERLGASVPAATAAAGALDKASDRGLGDSDLSLVRDALRATDLLTDVDDDTVTAACNRF